DASTAALPHMSEETPDDALMVLVAQGDHAACNELVQRHLGRILTFAQRMLGDRAAAEDVAQEVFTRLWMHAKRWRPGPARLSTWLHRIALNLCVDATRKREESMENVPEPIDPSTDAPTRLHEQQLQARVNAAVQTLTTTQRAAIALCYFDGLRNAEA